MIKIILCLLGVAFFVLCEYSLTKTKSYQYSENTKTHIKIRYMLLHIDQYLSVCQLGITILSLILGGIGEVWLEHELEHIEFLKQYDFYKDYLIYTPLISLMILTSLEMIFAESIPKSIALRSNKILPYLVYPLDICFILTKPIIFIMYGISKCVLKIFNISASMPSECLTTNEIETIVEQSISDNTTKDLLVNSLDFDNLKARDILTPRVNIRALSINATQDEIVECLKENYSRIPIYHKDLDNIRGVLIVKDVLDTIINGKEIALPKLMKRAFIILESKNIKILFLEMNKNKTHMAFVYNEHGDLIGLITLEDIIEQITGDIIDESDDIVEYIKQNEDGSYIFDSSILIEELVEYLPDIPLSSEYNTLSGLCNFIFGCIPKENQEKIFMNYKFNILNANTHKCLSVKIENLEN